MNSITLSWVDYTIFCLVFGGSCGIGIYFGCFGNRQQTKTDYLFGGRQMSIFPIATSLIASTLSSTSLLGIPTEIYLYGSQFVMMGVSVLIAGLLTNYVFLPVFYNLKLSTLYEYLELRFNVYVKLTASCIYVFDCISAMTFFVYASALAINHMTGFDLHFIAIALTGLYIFYTALGGLRGVVWTNAMQFCITAGTLCCVIIMGIIEVGGMSYIFEKGLIGKRLEVFDMDPDPTIRATFWSVVIGNTFLWLNYTATNPAIVQQMVTVSNLGTCRRALSVYIVGTVITRSLCCLVGLIMFVKYFSCDPLSAGYINKPDQIFPYYISDVAASTPGISGLFIATTFTTAMSALSTITNSLSGTIYIDFVERCLPFRLSERSASNAMKGIAVLLGVIVVGLIFVVEHLGTLLQLLVSFQGIVSGPIVGICTLGILFPIANAKGAISGSTIAFLLMVIIATGRHINNIDNSNQYLPLQTDSCNSTSDNHVSYTVPSWQIEPQWLYKLSFHYYGFIGTSVTVIIGLLISWITHSNEEVNYDYISPIARWCLKKDSKKVKDGVTETHRELNEPFLMKRMQS